MIVRTVKMTEKHYDMLVNAVAHLEYIDDDAEDGDHTYAEEIKSLNELLERWRNA